MNNVPSASHKPTGLPPPPSKFIRSHTVSASTAPTIPKPVVNLSPIKTEHSSKTNQQIIAPPKPSPQKNVNNAVPNVDVGSSPNRVKDLINMHESMKKQTPPLTRTYSTPIKPMPPTMPTTPPKQPSIVHTPQKQIILPPTPTVSIPQALKIEEKPILNTFTPRVSNIPPTNDLSPNPHRHNSRTKSMIIRPLNSPTVRVNVEQEQIRSLEKNTQEAVPNVLPISPFIRTPPPVSSDLMRTVVKSRTGTRFNERSVQYLQLDEQKINGTMIQRSPASPVAVTKSKPFQPKNLETETFNISLFENAYSKLQTRVQRDEKLALIKSLFHNKKAYHDVTTNVMKQDEKDKQMSMREQHLKLLLMGDISGKDLNLVWEEESIETIEQDKKQNNERIERELDALLSLLQKPRAALNLLFDSRDQSSLQPNEIMFMYKYRQSLYRERKLFVLVINGILWNDNNGRRDGLALLKDLPQDLTTEDALELMCTLGNVYEIRVASVKILEQRPLPEIYHFTPQLLQTVRKYESKLITTDDNLMMSFLLQCAAQSDRIYNKLCWALTVQVDANPDDTLYKSMQYKLLMLQEGKKTSLPLFIRQQKLVSNLSDVSTHLRTLYAAVPRPQKIQILQSILNGTYSSETFKIHDWNSVFPLDCLPDTFMQLDLKQYKQLHCDDCGIFKSAMAPLAIPFVVDGSGEADRVYKVIFKRGDDLRQDALIMQLIRFMDQVLKKNGLDLCLTPYNIVATGADTGFVEMVTQSHTIASVLDHNPTIYDFLEKHNSDRRDLETALDRYVRSCAGYCVITFILGVGDRHLDNLLLREDGSFFHIDFGFVLGNDPKPQFTTPPMRLTKEMVYAMRDIQDVDGVESAQFKRFKLLCCQAFTALRKYANVILLMLLLMTDSGLDQITQHNIRTVKQNFALHLSTEESNQYIENKINESVRMVLPNINEQFHKIAQRFRD